MQLQSTDYHNLTGIIMIDRMPVTCDDTVSNDLDPFSKLMARNAQLCHAFNFSSRRPWKVYIPLNCIFGSLVRTCQFCSEIVTARNAKGEIFSTSSLPLSLASQKIIPCRMYSSSLDRLRLSHLHFLVLVVTIHFTLGLASTFKLNRLGIKKHGYQQPTRIARFEFQKASRSRKLQVVKGSPTVYALTLLNPRE